MTQTDALSIASVTVVYNGGSVLRRHLESLKRQQRRLDEIVVVDNASTDDTRNLLASEYAEVTLLPQSQNGGVGGGFAAGLAYAALEKKHDWIWLFDQDSVPSPDTLNHLLASRRYLDGSEEHTAILAPACAHPETGTTYPGLSWQSWRYVPIVWPADQSIVFVDMVLSSGTLIRRTAIEQVGLPRADFFMDYVDYEHCLRLRRHGFQIAVVRDSILNHAIGQPMTFNILGRKKFWANHVPWREYYMTRNEIFTMWHYYPGLAIKVTALYRMVRHAAGVLLFGKQKLACLGMMYRGLLDGRVGRLGVRVFEGTSSPGEALGAGRDLLRNKAEASICKIK